MKLPNLLLASGAVLAASISQVNYAAESSVYLPFSDASRNEVMISDVLRDTDDPRFLRIYGHNLCAAAGNSEKSGKSKKSDKSKKSGKGGDNQLHVSIGVPSAINEMELISCQLDLVPELELEEIVAMLPEGMPDGSYRITVNNGKKEGAFEYALASPIIIEGSVGPQGEPGIVGETGAQGLEGPQGPEGPQGLQGIAGAEGPAGPEGPQGLQGEIGLTGPEGPIGPRGEQGIQGLTGAIGAVGPQGEQGPIGAIGPQGEQGIQGLTGPQGDTGPQGIQGLTGATGSVGPQGPDGLAGPAGAQGASGPSGPRGIQGPQGLAGTNGQDGAQGPKGDPGINGTNGVDGKDGKDGVDGKDGDPGPAGEAGTFAWFDGLETVSTTSAVGIGQFDESNPPTAPLHIRTDVAGPLFECVDPVFDASNILRLCFNAPFTPEHHAMVIENTRRTGKSDYSDESKYNTAGLAIVLNSFDDTLGFNLDPVNAINSADKFLSFYRKDQFGTTKMVGRVEAMGATDFDDIPNWAAATLATTARNFYNIWEFDIATTPFKDWIKFSDGELMKISKGNANACDGNPSGGFELCVPTIFDYNVDYGSLPKLTQLRSPITGISLGINDNAVEQMAQDFLFYAPNTAKKIMEYKADPGAWAVKKLIGLAGGAGVTYESGNGDYAEWLPKIDADENLVAADVVGVFGGKISRQTEGADHLMVVSLKPIVLGNMPPEGKEAVYEMVAFMGQVPVRVVGLVQEGDFLIPSGWEDGTAMAVNPAYIRPDQLDQVIGVAWESSLTAEGLVNTAVGLQNNDVARIIETQYTQITETASQVLALQAENARLEQGLAEIELEMQTVTTRMARNERQAGETMRLLEALSSQLEGQDRAIYAAAPQ